MTDEIWRRDETDSPCVKICLIHPEAKICIGCHRTGDEIAAWPGMTTEERRAVLDALPGRTQLVARRRGGRGRRVRG